MKMAVDLRRWIYMTQNILETKELSKTYRRKQALKSVSIHVPKNKVYCLIGPNGAGKTTIMKIISGMITATSGSVEINGHPWSRQDLLTIGSLIENAPLYGNLSAQDNLRVITTMLGLPESRISEVLKAVNLADVGSQPAKNYSLGMKQRLGIALALINHPQLLILDEPTNGLDPLGIQELRQIISDFKDQKITIIISSHILSEVEHLADYIAFINHGELKLEQAYDKTTDLEALFNQVVQEV